MYFRPARLGKMQCEDNTALMFYTLERAIRIMHRGTWQYSVVFDCQGKV